MNEVDNKRMDTFMFKCCRRILKIRWPYVISNDEILKRTKLRRISEEVKIRRWKWIGHVLRMEDNSDCITALTWKPEGRRKIGRPRTTWRRTVEKERNALGRASKKKLLSGSIISDVKIFCELLTFEDGATLVFGTGVAFCENCFCHNLKTNKVKYIKVIQF